MFDFDDDNDDNEFMNRITFRFWENCDGVSREVETVLKNKESYTDLAQQFVYFLQAIGYTYIGAISILDNEGEELHTTDI